MDFLKLLSLLLLAVCLVNGKKSDEDDEDEEISYSQESANWHYQSSQCKLLKKIESGETYYFNSFPPRHKQPGAFYDFPRQQPHHYYPIAHPYHVPFPQHQYVPTEHHRPGTKKTCTWKFTTDDNCELVLNVEHYERGDINCRKQHSFIGDEHSETKICGFAKPPKHLASSGSQLILKHVRRYGREYEQTPISYLTGFVTCIELLGSSYESGEEYHHQHNRTHYGNGTRYANGTRYNGTDYDKYGSSEDDYYGFGNGTYLSGNGTYNGTGDDGPYQSTMAATTTTTVPPTTTTTVPPTTTTTVPPTTTTTVPSNTTTTVPPAG